MGEHERAVTVRPLDRPGDLGWIVMAHGEIYADQFGWSTDFERMVARIVADYATSGAPDLQAGWIAEVDGERAGCIMCTPSDDPAVALLRVLLVTPKARGLGAGSRLVDACLRFAEDSGYRRIDLWTVAGLDSARRIYEAAGFELVGEEAQHSFGHDVVGQTWTRPL